MQLNYRTKNISMLAIGLRMSLVLFCIILV